MSPSALPQPRSHHPRTRDHENRRPPLSASKNTPPATRKERRAAERSNRFEDDRAARKSSSGSSKSGGGSSWINTKTMTIVGVVIGVLIVAFVGYSQLSGRASGKLTDPKISYPAELQKDNTLGTAGAPVVMEVYGDFQCPVCARHSLDAEPSLVNKYATIGQLQIIHHDINLLGRGTDELLNPALGSYCAIQQGKYWDYSHWTFENQRGENQGWFTIDTVTKIAVAAGLDQAQFSTCIVSQEAKDFVTQITDKAIGLGIDSTPTVYLNGVKHVGLKSAAEWSALIDAELAKASGAPAASASAQP